MNLADASTVSPNSTDCQLERILALFCCIRRVSSILALMNMSSTFSKETAEKRAGCSNVELTIPLFCRLFKLR